VVSQIDAIDPSCESLPDAAQLADVFTTRGSWWKVAAADLVALEVERRTEPQPLVVVDGLEEVATFVGSEDPDGSERRPIEIRQDSFAILELAATEPGDVYLFVHRIGDGRVGGTKPVWVDASGDVHFVGTCASTLWTPTFRNFAGHENWEGTQEELLVALILGGPERDALNEWTFGS
jgi:hypothetical protein